ncbi:MAG: ATP-dependent helicase [Bacillales bacterium]
MSLDKILNQKQYHAATSKSQYIRVIAGAGSGKTRALTYRIVHLIKDCNVLPRQILAITFTNKVANEMKERVVSILNNNDKSSVNIFTYHALCSYFLRKEIHNLNFTNNYTIIDDEDQKKLIKKIIKEKDIDIDNEDLKDCINKTLNYINIKKTDGQLPNDIIEDDEEQKKYLEYFYIYEEEKSKSSKLDFNDLIIYTIKILQSFENVRIKWQSYFKHILVDEFQDTNNLQFMLLKLLINKQTCLFVVGDPDQSIYAWRGSNTDLIMKFHDNFFGTETIILNQNYRSTFDILDVSNKLISNNTNRFEKELFTINKNSSKVELNCFNNNFDEARFIINKICSLKFSDVDFSYNKVAILYRSSYLSQPIETILFENKLPYKIYGGLRFYERAEIKDVIAYLNLLNNINDEISFDRIYNVPKRKIGDVSYNKLYQFSKNNGCSILGLVEKNLIFNCEIKQSIINDIVNLYNLLTEYSNKIKNSKNYHQEIIKFIKDEIKYIDYLKEKYQDDYEDRKNNVLTLFSNIEQYQNKNPDSNFVEYLQEISLLTSQDDMTNDNHINLMTIHTSKGLEFDYVFLVGLEEDVFPNHRTILESNDDIEEERRLAYVACTRAKNKLFLSYNEGFNYIFKNKLSPSRFIEEMGLKPKKQNNNVLSGINNFDGTSRNEVIYRYKMNKDLPSYLYSSNTSNKVSKQKFGSFLKSNSNNIAWNVGDLCEHEAFGDGQVLAIQDKILVINFYEHGQKSIISTHKKLKKKG